MKKLNLWKTLFCTAMALGAFTACSNDDSDDGKLPEITVDGGTAAAVAHDLTAGITSPVVTVVSNTNWAVSYSGDGANWCTPVAQEGTIGKKGTVKLVFDLGAATSARETTVTLTASGSYQGIPINPKVTITVKQNAGGTTGSETNVAAVRTLIKAMNVAISSSTAGQVDASADIKALGSIVGVVTCDPSVKNFGNANMINLQDDDLTAKNSGLAIFVGTTKAAALATGTKVSITLASAKVQNYNGTLQLALGDETITTIQTGIALGTPAVITPSQMPDYESQLVQIAKVQTASEYASGATYAANYNANFIDESGVAFTVRTATSANTTFGTTVISNLSGPIVGLAGVYQTSATGSQTMQLMPRNANDVAGLTQTRFTIQAASSTISQITAAGSYKVVNATVVATSTRSFLMNDGTGTILVFQGADATVPALNKIVTVEGAVSSYGGFMQFGNTGLTVTETGTGSYTAPATTTLDGAAMDALQAAPAIKPVKFTGTLTISGSYYNVAVSGATVTGSIVYPADGLVASTLSGKIVDVEGWYIGYSGSGNIYFNVIATKVTENTTAPNISITAPAEFAATAQSVNVAYVANNIDSSYKIFAKISGTDATQFSVPAGEISGTTVPVTTIANTTNEVKSAVLTIYAATAEDGTPVASATVTLTQAAGVTKNILAGWEFASATALNATSGNTTSAISRVNNTSTIAYTPSSKSIYCGSWDAAGTTEKYWLLTIPYTSAIPANSVLSIDWQGWGTGTSPKNWDVEYSTDNAQWTKIGSVVYTATQKTEYSLTQNIATELAVGTLYIRFKVNGTDAITAGSSVAAGGNSRLAQIEIFY